MNHCKFRRAVDDQKSHTLGEHKVTWPSEPGRGQGAHILVLKPYSNRGDTISTFLFPSASPQKNFKTFLLLLHPTALGKVSFYYTAYQKTTVFEIFNLMLIKNMYIQQQEQNRSYFYSTLAAVITTYQGIIEEIQNSSETESHVWSKNKKMIAKHNFCH